MWGGAPQDIKNAIRIDEKVANHCASDLLKAREIMGKDKHGS